MRTSFSPNLDLALAKWTNWMHHFSWFVLSISFFASVLASIYIQENFRINTSTKDMLSSELPFRKSIQIMDEAFPLSKDNILVVIDAYNSGVATEARDKLVREMKKNPKRFGTITDIAGENFFKTNGLLYLDVEQLYVLSDELAEAQPFITLLAQNPNLRGLFQFLEDLFDSSEVQNVIDRGRVKRLLGRFSEIAEAQIEGRFSQFSLWDLMKNDMSSESKKRHLFVVKPNLNYETLNPASSVMNSIRKLSETLSLTPKNGVRVRLTGSPAIEKEELDSVERGMGGAVLVSLFFVCFLLSIGLKHYQLILSTILVLIVGLILTTAFALLIFGTFNLISVAFAVLFIGLSVDFSIHYGLCYLEIISTKNEHNLALNSVVKSVGKSLGLAAICAALAFFSFLPTDYRGLAELGFVAGMGMLIAVTLTFSLLPALLSSFPQIRVSSTSSIRKGSKFLLFLDTKPKLICTVFLFLGCISLLVAPQVKFDFDPLNLKNRSSESMLTLAELSEAGEINPYSIKILASSLEEADKLAINLNQLAEVKETKTLSSYIPSAQKEKLEIIGSMALFLSPSLSNVSESRKLTLQQLSHAYDHFDDYLFKLISKDSKFSAQMGVPQFRMTLERLFKDQTGSIEEFEQRIFGLLPTQFHVLNQFLRASEVAMNNLPESLIARNISRDGRAKLEIIPNYDLRNPVLLEEFVKKVKNVVPGVTGSPVVIVEAGRAVLSSFFQAGLIAFSLIFFLLWFTLRNLHQIVIIFLPLCLSGILSLSIIVLLGLSFNFANVIVLPLLFGLGVAGSLHLVIRHNQKNVDQSILLTSTPRAILFSALTTVFSFVSISLSDHPGTASMGILLTITVLLTLLCTLIFLPAALKLTSRNH